MGTHISVNESKFHVSAKNVALLANDLRQYVDGWDFTTRCKSFTNDDLDKDIIQMFFSGTPWEVSFENNEVVSLSFENGQKVGDSEEMFTYFAEYVSAGSYIEIHDEHGDLFRWVFRGEKMVEIYPTITWEM